MWYDRWIRFYQWRERTQGTTRLLFALAGVAFLNLAILGILDNSFFPALGMVVISALAFFTARYLPLPGTISLWSEAILWISMLMLFSVGLYGLYRILS